MKKIIIGFLFLFSLMMTFSYKTRQKEQASEQQYDGPYVQYKNGQVFINYIVDNNGIKTAKADKISLRKKDQLVLNVMTDIPGKYFGVQLKKKLENEETEFPRAARLLALSDIEGNFGALRKLLTANKVIDEDFKWTFGNGHLVLTGDFFDRGQQVTEVLWLIYSLEEKAKEAGGYVHFILGNHEIMNLSGDLRYLNKKYVDNAILLNQNYLSLYDENSELGKWLRTKNVVEKIGDIIFTHAGISGNVNSMNVSLPEINKLVRPYYADTSFNYTDPRSDVLFSDLGPFWYRGYYVNKNSATSLQLDSTLVKYSAAHIVTGHTIVADTVSVWYDGKLLNTDVHHAEGKSEALLVEENNYYRVNADGRKWLLLALK